MSFFIHKPQNLDLKYKILRSNPKQATYSDYGKSKKAKPMLQPRWNKPNPAKDKS